MIKTNSLNKCIELTVSRLIIYLFLQSSVRTHQGTMSGLSARQRTRTPGSWLYMHRGTKPGLTSAQLRTGLGRVFWIRTYYCADPDPGPNKKCIRKVYFKLIVVILPN